jgi:hypothetical protein
MNAKIEPASVLAKNEAIQNESCLTVGTAKVKEVQQHQNR